MDFEVFKSPFHQWISYLPSTAQTAMLPIVMIMETRSKPPSKRFASKSCFHHDVSSQQRNSDKDRTISESGVFLRQA